MRRSDEIRLMVDTMIVETLLTDNHLSKFASGNLMTDLAGKMKDYFMAHIDQTDKTKSVINLLAPGALSVTLGALGLPWLGTLLGFALRVFNIDVNGVLKEVWSGVKSLVGAGKPVSSTQVDSIVDGALNSHVQPATQEEADKARELLEKKSSAHLLREARLLKLAMMEYEQSQYSLVKEAGLLSWFSGKKSQTSSLLGSVLKWIFNVALASAGLMVAGDAFNHFIGRPNAFDGTIQNGKEVSAPPPMVAKQTRFPVNPGYSDVKHSPKESWVENIPNNKASIENMLLNWAKEVYQGLNGLNAVIQSTAGFQVLADTIAWKNHASEGGPIVFIPPMFTSKKMVVDHFIDEVAEKAPK